jgi:hypothetical protein
MGETPTAARASAHEQLRDATIDLKIIADEFRFSKQLRRRLNVPLVRLYRVRKLIEQYQWEGVPGCTSVPPERQSSAA